MMNINHGVSVKMRLSKIIRQVNCDSAYPIKNISDSNANLDINAWLIGYGINT